MHVNADNWCLVKINLQFAPYTSIVVPDLPYPMPLSEKYSLDSYHQYQLVNVIMKHRVFEVQF